MSGGLLPPVIVRLLGDMTQLRGTLAQARAQVDGTAKGFKSAGATAAAGLATMGRSVSMIGVGAAVASVKMAGDFEAQTMVLHTAAGETLKNLSTVRKGILDISSGTGTGLHNLTDGMYQVEKAGYRGAGGLKVLRAAAQGAREENASLESVTNAMTSVMASYHLKATDSIRVMNGMKTAAGEGKMTMEQFAASLSTVLPIASANKVSFEEVTGAIATLTQHGTSAREATHELGSTIRNLASPNNVASSTMARFGLSATDVSTKLGRRGLTGTLDLLTQTVLSKIDKKTGTALLSTFNDSKQAAADLNQMLGTMPAPVRNLAKSFQSGKISTKEYQKAIMDLPGSQTVVGKQFATLYNRSHGFNDALKRGGPAATTYTDAIKKMTGGAIGLNTTLQLTGENTDGFKDRVHKVGESFNHASKDVEGWDATQKLFNVQLAKAKQTVQVLAIEVGTKLLPVVTSAISFFGQHRQAATALAAVIGGVLALSVVAYAAKLTIAAGKSVISFGKMGVSAAKGTANIIRGFHNASVAADEASGAAGTFGGNLRKGWDAAARGAKAGARSIGNAARSAGQAVKSLGSTIGRVSKSGATSAWNGTVSGVKGVGRAAKSAGNSLKTFGSTVGRVSRSAGRSAWTAMVSGLKGVGGALRSAALASAQFTRAMFQSAIAGVRAAASWVAQKVALVATAVAQRAAAAAEWLLNIALDANPVVLIVLGIMALIAGLVLAYNKIGWFRAFVDGAFKGIAAIVGWLVGFVKGHWQLLLAILTGPIGIAVLLVKKYWAQISGTVLTAVSWVVGFVKGHWQLLTALITGPIGIAVGLVVKYWGRIASGLSSAYHATVNVGRSLINWIAGLPGRAKAAASSLGSKITAVAQDAWSRFYNATVSKASEAVRWISGLPGRIRSGLGNTGGMLLSAGADLIRGFIQGCEQKAASAIATVRSIGSRAVASMKSVLGIHSPSRVFRQIGVYVNEGLIDGLTGSTARVKAATRRIESLLIQTYNRVEDLRGHKGVSKKWIRSHEKTIKELQSYVKKEDKALRALAAKRDSVATKLKGAQKKLKAVQKQWSDEVKSVADGIKQGFSIVTEAPQEGFALSSQDVVNHMAAQMKAATQFAAQLQTLKKKGLSGALIAQIAASGAEQGGATAAALANATKGQIDQINKLNKQTNSAATTAGKAVADSMYGTGVNAAKGLVNGLKSQEKAIEKQMLKIAKKMQAKIKKALGIHSPSRVFAKIGQWIPRGLATGVAGNTDHATRAITRMANTATQAGLSTIARSRLTEHAARSITRSYMGAAENLLKKQKLQTAQRSWETAGDLLKQEKARTAHRSYWGSAGDGFTGSGASLAQSGSGTVTHNHVTVEVKGHVMTERNLRDVVEKQMLQLGARNSKTYASYKR